MKSLLAGGTDNHLMLVDLRSQVDDLEMYVEERFTELFLSIRFCTNLRILTVLE